MCNTKNDGVGMRICFQCAVLIIACYLICPALRRIKEHKRWPEPEKLVRCKRQRKESHIFNYSSYSHINLLVSAHGTSFHAKSCSLFFDATHFDPFGSPWSQLVATNGLFLPSSHTQELSLSRSKPPIQKAPSRTKIFVCQYIHTFHMAVEKKRVIYLIDCINL